MTKPYFKDKKRKPKKMKRLPIRLYNQVKWFRERQGSLTETHLDTESKVWLLFVAHLLICSFIEQKWVPSVT